MPTASETSAKLSQSMDELSQKAKEARDRTTNTLAQTQDQLKARAAQARAAAERRGQETKAQGAGAKDELDSTFASLRTQVRDHFEKVHAKLEERRADLDAKAADHRAKRAEHHAEHALELAYDAFAEVEASILDAAELRATADAKARMAAG